MTARLQSWTRIAVASACLGMAAAGCNQSEGLGKGSFSYVCPAADSSDPGAPSPDAVCGPNGGSLGSLPQVAVGAPFSLQYSATTAEAPRPAVASLAVASHSDWATTQAGWLGFIAWSGSDVLDFTHVHAESIASVRLDPAITKPLVTGSITFVAATPLDETGTVLGGALPCTFTESNSAPLVIGGTGRVARLLARATGETTLSVECLGATAQVAIQVVGEQPSEDP